MRRADRLFQLIVLLGRGQVATARDLADRLEVSIRTVYRDIQDLMACGVPIDGQAGVGYHLRRGYQLPPLMFSELELEALVFGMQVVRTWGDEGMARAADDVLSKVDYVLPPQRRKDLDKRRLIAPGFHVPRTTLKRVGEVRLAIEGRRKLGANYVDAKGERTERVLWPLGLFYWGAVWSLGAWCELRRDFRNFRVDRFETLQTLVHNYPDRDGFRLEDMLAAMARQDEV